MFDCATCTVPILGETNGVHAFLDALDFARMRLPSLSSIVGDASTPAATPSNAVAKQAWIKIFMDGTFRIGSTCIVLLEKRETTDDVTPVRSNTRTRAELTKNASLRPYRRLFVVRRIMR